MKILVTGGVRSGKSRHAEELLGEAPLVTYVAPGPTVSADSDPDWAARVRSHQQRRPAHWQTLETHDLAEALEKPGAIIVDCLGTWLTALLDDNNLWEASSDEASAAVTAATSTALSRLAERHDSERAGVVFVTNEVGLGVIPSHRSGRLFLDLLGTVNQQIAAACDEVHLVVAGRVLVL